MALEFKPLHSFASRESATVTPQTDATIAIRPLTSADFQPLSPTYGRWCELFDDDPDARVIQHPDLLVTELARDCPLPASTTTPPAPEPQAVLCEAIQNNAVVALGILIPKMMSLRSAGGFLRNVVLRGYRLAGNRLLGRADAELSRRILAESVRFVRQQHGKFLLIEDLEDSDPIAVAANSVAAEGIKLFCPKGVQERWKIEFPQTPGDYWGKFSAKTRNTFRRKQKKIGSSRLVRISRPDQVAEFLEAAHAISKQTWQSEKLGLRIQNSDTELRYFTELASREWLRSYLLYVDDQPVAFLIGTQHNGCFMYEEVGYDRTFADRSPGQVLLLNVLEDLVRDNPPRVFDFGGGDADYKQLFATTCSRSGNFWLMPCTLSSRLLLGYLSGCRAIERGLRTLVKRLGATTYLRQRIRGRLAHSPKTATSTDPVTSPANEDHAAGPYSDGGAA
jgi:CelD/BcsL family acetyltransferase involved in cellulose biosynthesis